MSEVAPEKQITWKGKSEELKETSNELYIIFACLLYTSPSPRDRTRSRMPSSA